MEFTDALRPAQELFSFNSPAWVKFRADLQTWNPPGGDISKPPAGIPLVEWFHWLGSPEGQAAVAAMRARAGMPPAPVGYHAPTSRAVPAAAAGPVSLDPESLFYWARERHAIFEKRAAGLPEPWTADPFLTRKYRYCNVFRELDRTTIWSRMNIRDRYAGTPDLIPAIVIFRAWINHVGTGELVFGGNPSAFDQFMATQNPDFLLRAILVGGPKQEISGAYRMVPLAGMTQIQSTCHHAHAFVQKYLQNPLPPVSSLQAAWNWFDGRFAKIGPFIAYEIVSDLYHTDILRGASGADTWAVAGPGAVPGLNRLAGRPIKDKPSAAQTLAEMQQLLELSRDPKWWPAEWPPLTMREIEHSCCETRKYLAHKEAAEVRALKPAKTKPPRKKAVHAPEPAPVAGDDLPGRRRRQRAGL